MSEWIKAPIMGYEARNITRSGNKDKQYIYYNEDGSFKLEDEMTDKDGVILVSSYTFSTIEEAYSCADDWKELVTK